MTRVGEVARRQAAVIVMTTLLGACSSSPAPTTPAFSSSAVTSAPSTALENGPFVPPDQADALPPAGPIVGLVFADSIDPKGVRVNPRFTFTPDAPQITVGVQLGALSTDSGDLVVAWSQQTDTGATPLFSVHIAVQPGDVAFSTAKSQGVIAEGTYLVTATIEGHSQAGQVEVAPGPTAEVGFLTASTGTGQPPIQGPTGVGNVFGLGSRDDLQPDPSGCVRDWGVSLRSSALLIADEAPEVWAGMYDGCGSSTASSTPIPVQLRATIGDAGRVFQTTIVGGGWILVDPCTLGPNASDLPGTNVLLESRWQEAGAWHVGPSGTAVLTADTAAPKLHVTSTPAAGTKVQPGDTIDIDALASEEYTAVANPIPGASAVFGPWQTGVHDLQITADPGGAVGTPWTNPSNLPQSCDAKTWTHELQATYTVPENPPDAIQLCVQTNDYVGNERSLCRSFPTNDKVTITGTIETKSDVTTDSGTHTTIHQTATFTLVSTDGKTLTGTEATHFDEEEQNTSIGCDGSWSSGDISWTTQLTGTIMRNADGSLTAMVSDSSPLGPAYTYVFCSVATQANPVLLPPGGTLVNGKFDLHQDYPLGAGQTGYDWYEIHMEVVPNQAGT